MEGMYIINAFSVQEALLALIGYGVVLEDTDLDGATVKSFEDSGVMTKNNGLVMKLKGGSEFQITVVQTR